MMGLYPFPQIVSEVLMMSNTLQDFYNFANMKWNVYRRKVCVR